MKHLTLADEIVVLMLDDDAGEIRSDCLPVATVAAVGGVLMELSLQGRIDTDLTTLTVVDPTPTGDTLLDYFLKQLADAPTPMSSAGWIDELASRNTDLVPQVLARLVDAGILREDERRLLWMFSRRAYPQVSGQESREAKARLIAIIFNDEVPDPRDTLLMGLTSATGALTKVLTRAELDAAAGRISQVTALEEIGRAVMQVSDEIWTTAATSSQFGWT